MLGDVETIEQAGAQFRTECDCAQAEQKPECYVRSSTYRYISSGSDWFCNDLEVSSITSPRNFARRP